MESKELEEILECTVCSVLKKDMMRGSCCKGVIGQEGIQNCNEKSSNCPMCSSDKYVTESDHLINKILNVIRKKGGIGGEMVKFMEIEKHVAEGTKLIKGNICHLQIHCEKLLQHVAENHMEKLNEIFCGESSGHVDANEESSKYPEESEKKEESKDMKQTKRAEDVKKAPKTFSDSEKNSSGIISTRSKKNNKYYGEQPIVYNFDSDTYKLPKKCSEGGLNCIACMKLDLDSKEIICMHLINTDGRESYYEENYSTFKGGVKVTKNKKEIIGKGKNIKSTGIHGWKLHQLVNSMDLNKFPYLDLIIPEALKLDKKLS